MDNIKGSYREGRDFGDYVKKERVICQCGKNVSINTYKNHLKGKKCTLELFKKQSLVECLEIKTKHNYAWLKSLGKSATTDIKWYQKVIRGETKLEDWIFISPRPVGQVPPEAAKRSSLARMGANNPMVRTRVFNYSKEDLLKTVRSELQRFIDSDSELSTRYAMKRINEKHPYFAYMLVDDLPKMSQRKKLFKLALNLDNTSVEAIYTKKRGLAISKGQRASPTAMAIASATASKLLSFRISIPHKILFIMVKSLDADADFEYKKRDPSTGRTKSYDVYSPKINTIFEMHGRIWHDLGFAKTSTKASSSGKFLETVKRNTNNDVIKKSLALNLGYKYHAFWDHQIATWQDKLKEIYGIEPISSKDAENQIGTIDWKKGSI